MITEEELMEIFYKTEALRKGHFLLSSGNHSDTYFQCALVLQYPHYAEIVGEAIAQSYRDVDLDVVVSPAIGGIVAGQEVARALGCRALFCERQEGKMTFRRGFAIESGEKVLVVEDVITTGGSAGEVVDAAVEAGGEVAGVSCIMNRSGGEKASGFDILGLVAMNVPIYPPKECPLCRDGIPVVKPGSRKRT